MNLLDTRPPFAGINGEIPPEFKTLSTPCYLMDEAVLQHNAEVLGALQKRTGCKVLLAQKAFSNYNLYPIFAPHLIVTRITPTPYSTGKTGAFWAAPACTRVWGPGRLRSVIGFTKISSGRGWPVKQRPR